MNIEIVVLLVGAAAAVGAIAVFRHDEFSGWGVILITAALLSLLFFGIVASQRRSCRIFSEANGLQYRFTASTFCLVELEPGRWLSPDVIRYSDGGLIIETGEPK